MEEVVQDVDNQREHEDGSEHRLLEYLNIDYYSSSLWSEGYVFLVLDGLSIDFSGLSLLKECENIKRSQV